MCTPEKFEELKANLWNFMRTEIYPNELKFAEQSRAFEHTNEWTHPPILIELIQKAKKVCPTSALTSSRCCFLQPAADSASLQAGLWNMWMPVDSAKMAGKVSGVSYGGIMPSLWIGLQLRAEAIFQS